MDCILNRPALGNTACLGDLYDARTDRFCNLSILSRALPDQVIQCTESPFVDLKFIYSEAVREKLAKLGIEGSISLSILAGLVPLEGSGKYLQEENQAEHAVRSTLLYSVGTKVETVNVHHEDFPSYVSARALGDQDGLTACGATHVVTKIDWGAKVLVTLESAVKGKQHIDEIKLGLRATLDKLAGTVTSAKISGDLDARGKSANKETHFTLRIFGDILPKRDGASSEIPQNYEEALRFLRAVPALVQAANNGKGKPTCYGLIPLSVLQNQIGLVGVQIPRCHELTTPFITKFLNIFSQLAEIKQELSTLQARVGQHERFLPRQQLSEFSNFQQRFDESEKELKHELKTLLVQVRSGNQDESQAIDGVSGKLRIIQAANEFLGRGDNEHVHDHRESLAVVLTKKVERVETFTARGIHCIGRSEGLESTVHEQAEAYVLVSGSGGESDAQSSKWNETKRYFYELIEKHGRAQDSSSEKLAASGGGGQHQPFFYLDSEVCGSPVARTAGKAGEVQGQGPVIRYYSNGRCEQEDVYGEYCKRLKIPIVGTYELVSNGNFGEYLTAIGVRGLQWYAVTKSWLTVRISEENGRYTVDMRASVGSSTQSFILGKEFGDQTTDGWNATNLVTRDVNKLIHVQTLHDTEKTRRITTREFTEHEMIVKLEANGVTATRTFKRK